MYDLIAVMGLMIDRPRDTALATFPRQPSAEPGTGPPTTRLPRTTSPHPRRPARGPKAATSIASALSAPSRYPSLFCSLLLGAFRMLRHFPATPADFPSNT
eukprot:1728802-Prymnesium_polylepis.2